MGLRIDSFWGRRVGLNDLVLEQPHLHVRVEKDGTSKSANVCRPANRTSRLCKSCWTCTYTIVAIKDGWILYNDVKSLFEVEGGELQLTVNSGGSLEQPAYLERSIGNPSNWQGGETCPFPRMCPQNSR